MVNIAVCAFSYRHALQIKKYKKNVPCFLLTLADEIYNCEPLQ